MTKSILILGATGATGIQCIEKLAERPGNKIHAFVRNPAKLDTKTQKRCKSIQTGDAKKVSDLRRALTETNADWVVVALGNGADLSAKSNTIRTSNAQVLAPLLEDPDLRRVRVLVISSNGAASSKIIVGLGIGMMISSHLRNVLNDHTGQENAFASISHRTIVVRPTALTSDAPTGKLVEFPDTKKGPSIKTDRADLAERVVGTVGAAEFKAGAINITGVKK